MKSRPTMASKKRYETMSTWILVDRRRDQAAVHACIGASRDHGTFGSERCSSAPNRISGPSIGKTMWLPVARIRPCKTKSAINLGINTKPLPWGSS